MARSNGVGSGGRKHSTPFSSASFHNASSSSSTAGPSRREKSKANARPTKRSVPIESLTGEVDASSTFKIAGKRRPRVDEDVEAMNVYDYEPTSGKRPKDDSKRYELSKEEASYVGFNRRRPYKGGKGGMDDDDEEAGGGEEGDSDEEMAKRIRRAARTIAGEGTFKIRAPKTLKRKDSQDDDEEGAEEDEDADGDDSDIDSDEAFEGGDDGEDEDRWGDVFRSLGKGKEGKGLVRPRELPTTKVKSIVPVLDVDLSESEAEEVPRAQKSYKANLAGLIDGDDEDEDEDGDDEDGDEDEDEEVQSVRSGGEGSESVEDDEEGETEGDDARQQRTGALDSDESSSDEDAANDILPDPSLPSDEDMLGSSSEDDDEEDDLLDFVTKLNGGAGGSKRKAELIDGNDITNEDVPTDGDRKKRRILMSERGPGGRDEAGVYGAASNAKVTLASLIAADPSLKSSASILLKGPSTSTSILKSGTLAAPLPIVVQERLARQAAYDETKKEGDKWGGVMKRVKEAEYLRFPLQGGGVSGAAGETGAKERRSGGLKTAGEMIGAFQPRNDLESAVTALLDSANLKDAQLAKVENDALEAADLTVEEVAERRAALRYERELMFRAEAKSKRVAKIKSKTYRKLARKRAGKEMNMEDLQRLDPEAAEEEAMKLESLRAKERATLKHSTKSSRWAQQNHGAGETADKRREIEDMLARGEKLKRKIRGVGSDESDEDASDDVDTDDQDEDAVRARAFDELARLKPSAEQDDEAPKGIMALPFMKRALAKRDDRADAEERELRKQLENYDDRESDLGSDDGAADDNHMRVNGNVGRMVFSGKKDGDDAAIQQKRSTSPDQADEDVAQESDVQKASATTIHSASADVNPWLSLGSVEGGRAKKKNVGVGKDSKAVDKANLALKKAHTVKSSAAKALANDDARIDIVLAPQGSGGKPKSKDTRAAAGAENDDSGSSDDEVARATGVKAFKQRDLVAEAFAGDNVIEDFAAEKQRAILADAPKEEDMTLAGWGSWGGKGVKKNPKARKFIKVTAGIDPTKRKDFQRSNVIITEKRDKKASKYLPTDLPYPYTSAAQYEASFATPVGSDWNTRATHQRATMPRVTKKPGAIIEPVSRLF